MDQKVDQFPTRRPPTKSINHSTSNNNICSSKQTRDETDRTKYQPTNRSISLPSRHIDSSNRTNSNEHFQKHQHHRRRRRYASDSNHNNRTTTLVTSFIQYLRCELRATSNDRLRIPEKKSTENIDNLLEIFHFSNNFYRQQYPIIDMNNHLQENSDDNEILKLINLLVLRVELLSNDDNLMAITKNKKKTSPIIKQIDQNLIEYLYFLFNKFIKDDCEKHSTKLDKTNFVHVCQQLVRNGCLHSSSISHSPDRSSSETTITNTNQSSLTVHEYHSDGEEKSVCNDQDTWLIVDLEPIKPNPSATLPDQSKCLLPPSSTSSDEQFILSTNENYYSFEELKSCESESSQSNYYSPNSSLVDLHTMVQELDEINNTNNNNNTLLNEDSSTANNPTNISNESSFDSSCHENICPGLIIEDNEQQQVSLTMNTPPTQPETLTIKTRKEKKIQERWTKTDSNNKIDNEQMPTKTFLGVEFPPIAALRRKFSSLPPTPPILNPPPLKKKSKTSSCPSTSTNNNNTNHLSTEQEINTSNIDKIQLDQTTLDGQVKNDILSLNETSKTNDIEQVLINLNEENNLQQTNMKEEYLIDSSCLVSLASRLSSNIDENKSSNEVLLREKEEDEEQISSDNILTVTNIDEEEKKNNCNEQSTRTVLPNGKSTVIVSEEEEEEKKEQQQSDSLAQRQENSSSLPSSINEVNSLKQQVTMSNDDERYKKIEIEEIPDEDDDLSVRNKTSIEPIDCILTDDELNNSRRTNLKTPEDLLSKQSQLPPVPKRTLRPEDDPIALRALERFEQRMSAATKTTQDETNPSTLKSKSSWSTTPTTTRKSFENLLNKTNKDEQSSNHRDSFIRPRKTMLDELGLNFGLTTNLNSSDSEFKEQTQPKAIIGDDNKQTDSNIVTGDLIDFEDYPMKTEEKPVVQEPAESTNEKDNSDSLVDESPANTIVPQSSTEQQNLTPYRLQLEGRRRLNTLERVRERQQNLQAHDLPPRPPPMPTQIQLQSEYTVKPEDLQDPIIRRALERFDEKSRSLSQTRTNNYNDIQDPVTRRALMRLDTNLKRTNNPSAPIANDSNETWFTNSYTLGSLQSNPDPRLLRYPDSTLPANMNSKPTHVSVHQRFCSTSSSDMSELPLNNQDQSIPVMRVPTQPIYVTSSNQQQPSTINLRQRSRSEDMLSTRELSLGQTTNFDEQNQSMEELQQNDTNEIQTNPMMKTIDPNFIRSNEASVNYTTPTQAYTAYSCEYTRPHRTQSIAPSKSEIISPRNFQHENDLQTSSAFTPVHPSTNNNHYPPPLPPSLSSSQLPVTSTPAYNSMYTSNNLQQTPYSDDPIVRRALERFNCQMQNSLMSMSQHSTMLNRQFQNGYLSQEPYQHETWTNPTRPPATSTGYQSIIGRRRQVRHDDGYHDHTSIGNGYSSSLFLNNQPYSTYSDETNFHPPHFHRDPYHEQQDYLSENFNNNNNNNHLYAYNNGMINGFQPINHQYIPPEYYQQYQDDELLRHRAQSTSSTTSSDSINHIRLMQQRLPPTSTRNNFQLNKNSSPENSQIPSGQTTPSNGSGTSDSVFHRLAYTSTKASLSKSSSNLCANLPNRSNQQPVQTQQIKTEEIDFEEANILPNEPTSESLSQANQSLSKCQRSRSVDGRARLKNAQNRLNNIQRSTTNDDEDNSTHQSSSSSTVPSSKFTPVNTSKRDNAPPPRVPISARSNQTNSTRRLPNGTHKNIGRTRNSNGNLLDTDNDENLSLNESYQPKILDSKTRINHRHTTNNIQTSASTSSVNSTHHIRTKVPVPVSSNLERKDSNISGTDLYKSSNRLLSPQGQRRSIPVSVFAPAKRLNSSLSSPTSTSPTNETLSTDPNESQNNQNFSTIQHENDINTKLSSSNSSLKSSTGNLLNELSFTNEKHDHGKKMNVFERLFRGHKNKV